MLEVKNISKSFPGVKALDKVSLQFAKGEIHAVLGENGAGKSTLMKIIAGIYHPDEGEIFIEGKKVHFADFLDAMRHGISMVNQEVQIIPESSVAENIMLDKLDAFAKRGVIQWKSLFETAQKYASLVSLEVPMNELAGKLSAAQKQLIQIARALSSNAKVILLDEPTSSITRREIENLFEILRKLRDEDKTLIFVSHKIEEVLELCDKISVLRDGRLIGTISREEATKQKIVKMMIGRDTKEVYLGKLDVDYQQKVLEVKNLSRKGKVENISFCLYKGEILGLYGLVGSGRTELAKILIGEDHPDSGEIHVYGQRAYVHSPADSLYRYNMGYVSENRKEEGLIPEETVRTNICITVWSKILNRVKAIDIKKENQLALNTVKTLDIKTPHIFQMVNNLSGGNQQKVSIAKWLVAGCDILIIDEPTIGVDVGAKEQIHELIWNLAKKEGKSIILISSDMPELIKLARRILVFKNGRIVGEIDGLNEREIPYQEVSERIGALLG